MSEPMDYHKLKQEMREIQPIVSAYPEKLQPAVLQMLLGAYLGKDLSRAFGNVDVVPSPTTALPSMLDPEMAGTLPAPGPKEQATRKKSKGAGKGTTFKHLKELNTGFEDDPNSVFGYLARYKPKSNMEKNVVFVKYFTDEHPGVAITMDHIYTSFINSNSDLAKAPDASVRDCQKPRWGWLDASSMDDIKLTHNGIVKLQKMEKEAAATPKGDK